MPYSGVYIIYGLDRIKRCVFFSLYNEDAESNIDQERMLTRGNARKLNKGRYVRRLRKDSFAFRVVNHWNDLSNDVVLAQNLNTFKSKLNTHYKNHPLKFVPSFM